jgi:hypothetical protein
VPLGSKSSLEVKAVPVAERNIKDHATRYMRFVVTHELINGRIGFDLETGCMDEAR